MIKFIENEDNITIFKTEKELYKALDVYFYDVIDNTEYDNEEEHLCIDVCESEDGYIYPCNAKLEIEMEKFLSGFSSNSFFEFEGIDIDKLKLRYLIKLTEIAEEVSKEYNYCKNDDDPTNAIHLWNQ